MELDYLAPFLAQAGDPEKITHKLAYQLKEDCLADLKQRLIDKANLIQARFEKVTSCYIIVSPVQMCMGYYDLLINIPCLPCLHP
jgi:hypothetical protein